MRHIHGAHSMLGMRQISSSECGRYISSNQRAVVQGSNNSDTLETWRLGDSGRLLEARCFSVRISIERRIEMDSDSSLDPGQMANDSNDELAVPLMNCYLYGALLLAIH